MSHTERGIYITLLCLCWLEHSLPADVGTLAKLVDVPPRRFTKLWAGVLSQCFTAAGDGRLYQKRLDVEREKQDRFRRRQSDAAASRWDARPDATALPRVALPTACPREEDSREKTLGSEKGSGEKPNADEIGQRAHRLIENYPRWFSQYRAGATTLGGGPIDFQKACEVCTAWDDARIEKLAALVLTTDEGFIAGTDRAFRIFAMKASWADDRLRQWERKKQGIA